MSSILRLYQLQLLVWLVVALIELTGTVGGTYCGYPLQYLPRWFTPISYDLNLNTMLGAGEKNFEGQVDIKILKTQPGVSPSRQTIIMHAGANLVIKTVQLLPIHLNNNNELVVEENNPMRKVQVCHDQQYELLVIEFDQFELGVTSRRLGALNLRIDFVGQTPVNGVGLLRLQASQKSYLVSRFNRFDAHLVFPCFDEPNFKTTFELRLGIFEESNDSKNEAISIGELEIIESARDEFGRNLKVYKFAKTHSISVHQFGFIIGHQFSHNKSGPIHFISHKPQVNPSPKFGQTTLTKAFETLKEYFRTQPVESDVRIVSLPNIGQGFGVNMAGLIVADAELVDRQSQPEDLEETTMYVASCIELLARQWIGIMVTMELDNESWVFEGLIGVIVSQITDRVYPNLTLDYRLLYAKQVISPNLKIESLPSAQLILPDLDLDGPTGQLGHQKTRTVNPSTVDEDQKLSRGEYALNDRQKFKAVSIFSYIDHACGVSKYIRVMQRLMTMYSGRVVRLRDFLFVVETVCRWRSKLMFKMLKNQPGFPLIKADLVEPNKLVLSQERFLNDYSQNGSGSEGLIWEIPIRYVHGELSEGWIHSAIVKMVGRPGKVGSIIRDKFSFDKPGIWVKINNSFKGFYRVLYSDRALDFLMQGVDSYDLNHVDYFQLISDARAIFESGKRGAYYLVKTLRPISKTNNWIVREELIAAYRELKYLYTTSNMARETKTISKIIETGLSLFDDTFLDGQFKLPAGGSEREKSVRVMTAETLAQLDHETLTTKAIELFRSPELVNCDDQLHTAIFIAVARNGSSGDFKEMLEMLESDLVHEFNELDFKLVIGLANAKLISRLHMAWYVVKSGIVSPKVISEFIRALLNSFEGLQFTESVVIPDLNQVIVHFSNLQMYEIIREICLKIVETDLCSNESTITHLFDETEWDELREYVDHHRSRNYFRQHLDLNKLV